MYIISKKLCTGLLLFTIQILVIGGLANAYQSEPLGDLTALSVEDLMDLEVSLADRKPRKVSQSAAAVFVVTAEDIRRSGATSIPDALRMVPGLQVTRLDANKWVVASRGFTNRYTNMMLVLMDGRIAYSQLFSGVFWELQDTLLEDIDRIEIIRGPGASLWGANAVNGIVNIITKHAEETLGGLVFTGMGTEEKGMAGARYGGMIGEKGYYRIYTKYFQRDEAVNTQGEGASDDWDMLRGGLRTDVSLSHADEISFQGNFYQGKKNERLHIPSLTSLEADVYDREGTMSGINALGRWQHTFSDTSDMMLQLCYSHSEDVEFEFSGDEDILDIDFQHRFALGHRQEVVWGLGYRLYSDDLESVPTMAFDPLQEKYHIFSAFVQDDICFAEDRIRLTLGAKFEHNSNTGFEFQPNIRVLWAPNEKHTLWAAASRAVKTPSRTEKDMELILQNPPLVMSEYNTLFPLKLTLIGDQTRSQEVLALEMGYRVHPATSFSLDIAAFYNIYDELLEAVIGSPRLEASAQPPYLSVPIYMNTGAYGKTWGLEFSVKWTPWEWWCLQTAYTYFKTTMHTHEGVQLLTGTETPNHQLSLRSSLDISQNFECDLWLRYVDDILGGTVKSYTALDFRVGWKPCKNMELSIVGQNLLESQHREYYEYLLRGDPGEVERSVYGKITWKF